MQVSNVPQTNLVFIMNLVCLYIFIFFKLLLNLKSQSILPVPTMLYGNKLKEIKAKVIKLTDSTLDLIPSNCNLVEYCHGY